VFNATLHPLPTIPFNNLILLQLLRNALTSLIQQGTKGIHNEPNIKSIIRLHKEICARVAFILCGEDLLSDLCALSPEEFLRFSAHKGDVITNVVRPAISCVKLCAARF
jgi:hypothetical protein